MRLSITALLLALGCTASCSDGSAGDSPTGGGAAGATDDDDGATSGSGAAGAGAGGSGGSGAGPAWPEYSSNPFVFELDFVLPAGTSSGGVFVHDVDGDELLDFVITAPDNVAVYDHWGKLLWREEAPIQLSDGANGGYGYPGRHAPGAIAGDVDGDGAAEVAYLTTEGILRIRDGATGMLENGDNEAAFTFPGGGALAIANFRGLGDRDALVQYNQWELRAISLEDGQTLWHTVEWSGIEHSAVRVADVDGDGKDEVVGPNFFGADGQRLNGWDLEQDQGTHLGGLDSLSIGDIVPGAPLEVALAETAPDDSGIGVQSGEAIVVNPGQIVWGTTRPSEDIPPTGQCATEKDPDKLAVGDFDVSRPGLEVFARSACARHPWVMDATGAIFATWNVSDTAPAGWFLGGDPIPDSEGGIDVVTPIQWNPSGEQHVLAKERHMDGKVAIVHATTGAFEQVFDTLAARTYVADIAGDHREEAVIVEATDAGNARVKIFWNGTPAGEPAQPRRWTMQHYRRIKQNHNYYSP